MDASGRLVFIEDLRSQERLPGFNCSGFAKWVVDGFYAPITGTYLPIEPLKEKHLAIRGNGWTRPYEESRDPFFGLDWTRNLARYLDAARRAEAPQSIDIERYDVRAVPFSRYAEDMGYLGADLPRVLLWLAHEEPGTIYLGSVAREYGEKPVLRQHAHVVVFLPYVDENGVFRVSVMERNVETSLESITRRYGDDLVHLVRIPSDGPFTPPIIESPEPLR
jgi:hypothetical protein